MWLMGVALGVTCTQLVAVDGGAVCMEKRRIVGLDAEGAPSWTWDKPGHHAGLGAVTERALLVVHSVYHGVDEPVTEQLTALDPRTGKVLWVRQERPFFGAAVVLSDGTLMEGGLLLDAATGQTRPVPACERPCRPYTFDHVLGVGDDPQTLVRISTLDGRTDPTWSTALPEPLTLGGDGPHRLGGAAGWGSRTVFGAQGALWVLDGDQWRTVDLPGEGRPRVVLSTDDLLVVAQQGRLVAISPDDGVVWSVPERRSRGGVWATSVGIVQEVWDEVWLRDPASGTVVARFSGATRGVAVLGGQLMAATDRSLVPLDPASLSPQLAASDLGGGRTQDHAGELEQVAFSVDQVGEDLPSSRLGACSDGSFYLSSGRPAHITHVRGGERVTLRLPILSSLDGPLICLEDGSVVVDTVVGNAREKHFLLWDGASGTLRQLTFPWVSRGRWSAVQPTDRGWVTRSPDTKWQAELSPNGTVLGSEEQLESPAPGPTWVTDELGVRLQRVDGGSEVLWHDRSGEVVHRVLVDEQPSRTPQLRPVGGGDARVVLHTHEWIGLVSPDGTLRSRQLTYVHVDGVVGTEAGVLLFGVLCEEDACDHRSLRLWTDPFGTD